MAYRNFNHRARPTPRSITVKFAGNCVCCGGEIKAGEYATYYPPGTIASVTEGKIGHTGGLEGNSAKCTDIIRRKNYPEYAAEIDARERERRMVDDFAGSGMDERWEDDGARQCGLL